MNSYHMADHLLQFALNAWTSFLLFSLLTEGALRLFRIQNPRLRALFRLLPPLKLALAPLFLWLPFHLKLIDTSIFSCSHPIQQYLVGQLPQAVQQQLSLNGMGTLTGSLLIFLPLPLIFAALAVVAAVSIVRLCRLTLQYAAAIAQIRGIRQRALNCNRPIFNGKLSWNLQKQKSRIQVSPEVSAPLAAWGNCIIIPQDLFEKLHQSEYETVIAHELEHLRWRDTLVRMLYNVLAALYWWVPMNAWLSKLEQEQELASDFSVHTYALKGIDLAAALKKTFETRHERLYKCAAFVRRASTRQGQPFRERIHAILNPAPLLRQNKASAWAGTLIMLCLTLILTFSIC